LVQLKAAAAAYKAEAQEELPEVDKSQPLRGSVLGRESAEDVREEYDIGNVLGIGQFGVIRLATHKTSGFKYACKSINKSRLAAKDAAIIRQELQIMHHMAGGPFC
jgi:serine/threonine protein kinase